jgi:hypothetical protein
MFACTVCGIPFSNAALLDNHRRRFCTSSKIDREAQRLLDQRRSIADDRLLQRSGWNPSPTALAPSPLLLDEPIPSRAASTPPVLGRHDLLDVIREQQQQINLLKMLVFGSQPQGAGQISRGHPLAPLPARSHGLGLRPLDGPPLAGALVEGRYVLHLRAAEGLASLLQHIPARQAAALADGHHLVIQLRHFVSAPEATLSGGPTLLLNERASRIFTNAPVSLNFSKRDGFALLRRTRYGFSVLPGEVPIFSVEFLIDGKTLAWTEVTGDALGERIRPLRLPPVDMARALANERARLVGNAMTVVEFTKANWHEESSDDDMPLALRAGPLPALLEGRQQLISGLPAAAPGLVSQSSRSTPFHQPLPARQQQESAPLPAVGNSSPQNEYVFPQTPERESPAGGSQLPSAATTASHPSRRKTISGGGGAKSGGASAAVSTVKLGHGPRGDACRLNIDRVDGVPSCAAATRVLVYLSGTLGDSGLPAKEADDAEFFAKSPELIAFQEADSPVAAPAFHGELCTIITKSSMAVAVVECVEARGRYTLGHAVLPLNAEFFSGSYTLRLRQGDPRKIRYRTTIAYSEPAAAARRKSVDSGSKPQTAPKTAILQPKEADELSEVLAQQLLQPPPDSLHEYVPACYLVWRGDCADRSRPATEPPGQLPKSENELMIERDRSGDQQRSATPFQNGVVSTDAIIDMFTAAPLTELYDSAACLAPYNPGRGFFVRLHALRGVGVELAYFKVSIIPPPPADVATTRHVDMDSDIAAPMFADPPFQFRNVEFDKRAVVLFNVYKFTDPDARVQSAIRQVGWAVVKVFLDNGAVRHGLFEVPVFSGAAPTSFMRQLEEEQLTTAVSRALAAGTIDYATPRVVLTLSQGDPLRAGELSDDCLSRADPRVLLIVPARQREFPLQSNINGKSSTTFPLAEMPCRGLCGRTNPDEFQSALHKQFLRFVDAL